MAPESHNDAASVVTCPCQGFGTIQAIRSTLDSDERTVALVAWLADHTTTNDNGRRVSCQPRENLRCVRRVSVSFSILNGIRDACRPFLESSRAAAEPSYEEAFPSLSKPSSSEPINVLVARKKPKKKVVLSRPETERGNSKGNISMLPSTEPMRTEIATEWPAISTGNNSMLEKETKKKTKRRIAPTRVSAWGPASKGNISTLSATDSVFIPTRTDFQKVTKSSESPAKITSDRNHESTKPTQNAARFRAKMASDGKHESTKDAARSIGLGNISTVSSTDPVSVPTRADFQKAVQSSEWPAKKASDRNNDSKKPFQDSTIETVPLSDQHKKSSKQNGTMHFHDMVISNCDRRKERYNLARIYSTLLRCHLVPSSALELHLMVRLLTAKDDSAASTTLDGTGVVFRSLFATGSCCRSFAVDVLTQVTSILRNLHLDIIVGFTTCPPFVELLPNVTNELIAVVQRRREISLLSEVESVSIAGSTKVPLLTLPFDHDRDSRHNYRSREEMAIYKNREESRDAFMYQLRAFQSVRGKVLDAVQAERSVDRIRTASKNVIQRVLKCNMFWFAQMFCDLMVQIGLVPMEETDKELLNITDKEKLQKLHKRFSSKGTQTRKSTRNLVLDPSKDLGAGSPLVEAPQFFPGHQEFFFIFIMSTDCYSFGFHVKNRLKIAVLDLATCDATKGFEKRLSHLQMLSRFLGLLVFSPSWHESGGGPEFDSMSKFDPEIPLVEMVERAWKERHLVFTVPWVVEFLRMAQWSPALIKSDTFKRLLALLVGIHHQIIGDKNEASDSLSENMQLVSLYFETLFGDIIGLDRAVSLSMDSIVEPNTLAENLKSKSLDASTLRLSNSLLFSSNPHVEELFALLSSLTQGQTKLSGSSRKLTPYSISSGIASSSDPLRTSNSISASPIKLTESRASEFRYDEAKRPTEEHSVILAKLVEAFFHQHRDLKELCEFIVNQTLKNVAVCMRDECVIPFLEKRASALTNALGDGLNCVEKVEEEAIEASRTFLEAQLETTIPRALALLCPPRIQPRVRDVAAKLSISHATQLGESTVDSLVRLESKKFVLDNARKAKKQATALETEGPQVDERDDKDRLDVSALKDTVVLLRNALINRMWERSPGQMVKIVKNAKEELSRSENRSLDFVRGFFGSIEHGSVPLLQWCLQTCTCDSKLCWRIAADFLGLLNLLVTKCEGSGSRYMKEVTAYLAENGPIDAFIEMILEKGSEASAAHPSEILLMAGLFLGLANARIVPFVQLEAALIRSLHGCDGRILCQHFISNVDESRNGRPESVTSSLDLTRLRHELDLTTLRST